MTRINLLPPSKLHQKHLVAEYRELPRIFGLAHKCPVPSEYVLGTGHMTFFYNKLLFLAQRQVSLIREMRRRGYIASYTNPYSLITDAHVYYDLVNDWTPTAEAIALSVRRLKERMPDYYG